MIHFFFKKISLEKTEESSVASFYYLLFTRSVWYSKQKRIVQNKYNKEIQKRDSWKKRDFKSIESLLF